MVLILNPAVCHIILLAIGIRHHLLMHIDNDLLDTILKNAQLKGVDTCRYSVYTFEWYTLSGYMVYTFEKCLLKKHLSPPKYKYIEMNIIILSLSITYIIFVKLSVKSEGRNFSVKMLIF